MCWQEIKVGNGFSHKSCRSTINKLLLDHIKLPQVTVTLKFENWLDNHDMKEKSHIQKDGESVRAEDNLNDHLTISLLKSSALIMMT